MKKLALLAALIALIAPARADYLIRDGSGTTVTVKAGTLGSGYVTQALPYSSPVDATGTPYSASNPLSTRGSGSTGTDNSVNGPSIPADGTFVLLTTIPVNAARASVGVQNQAAITLQLVRDDGAGANQTSIFLTGPFRTWESATFKGRVRVYGPTGTSVAAYQD